MPATVYNGVFNVTQGFSGIAGLYANGTNAGPNTTNLNMMVATLLDSSGPTLGNGGTLEFPSAGTYAFNGPISIGKDLEGVTQASTITLRGTGQGKIDAPILLQQGSSDLFVVNNVTNVGSQDIGGVVFQDLMMSYTTGASGDIAAVHVQGGSNCVRLYRVTFVNCPMAYWLEKSLSCSMIDCQVYNASNAGIPVRLGNSTVGGSAIETYIAGSKFLCYMRADGTAAQIYGAEHLRMNNVRMEGWGEGIVIAPTKNSDPVRKLYFGNVSSFSYQDTAQSTTGAALRIEVSGGNYVTEVWFAQCELAATETVTLYTGPGVVIDPGTDVGDVIDQIRFVSCYSTRWPGPGMNIVGGTNIEVLGGYYSCNGASPGSGYQSAGIQISGAASGVRITGAACNNSVFLYGHQQPQNQEYGIYVSNGAQSLRINGCDLTGNLTNSLVVDASEVGPSKIFVGHCDCTGIINAVRIINASSVEDLEIFHCPGYNDQRPDLNGNEAPGLATPLSASTCSTPYFGPSVVTFSNPSALSVEVTGVQASMNFGSLYLSRPTDPVGFSAQPSVFAWIGK